MNDLLEILNNKKAAEKQDRREVSSAAAPMLAIINAVREKFPQVSIDELMVYLTVADAYSRAEILSSSEIGERLGIPAPKMTRIIYVLSQSTVGGRPLNLIHVEIDPVDRRRPNIYQQKNHTYKAL